MIAKPESWSRPAEPARAAGLALAALALFGAAWVLLHAGFYTHDQIVDTPVYQRYGDAMAHGQVPYRDFDLEYPPGALPVFVLPALGHAQAADFDRLPQRLRGADVRLRDGGRRAHGALRWRALGALGAALGLVALVPARARLGRALALRPLADRAHRSARSRRSSRDRDRLGSGLLGLGAATKIFPARAAPARARVDVAAARPARGARLRRASSLGVVAAVFAAVHGALARTGCAGASRGS